MRSSQEKLGTLLLQSLTLERSCPATCSTLLTTEECLLNHNRNPTLSREEIEGWLQRMLGVQVSCRCCRCCLCSSSYGCCYVNAWPAHDIIVAASNEMYFLGSHC